MFSSAATQATLAMGTVRPLIPLQIDPPDHVKYRKILDPLFAPRHMAALEAPVAALVHELIDAFVDRGECDFSTEFSVPLPSQVFLTLLGLPLSDLPTFLTMKDGVIRPDHIVGKSRERPGDHRVPEPDRRRRSTRTSTRCSTSARSSAATTCSAASSTPRSTATGSRARTSSTSASSS